MLSAEVLIIGAGAAGLAAAEVLSGAGLSVIVLEARDRVGGRCWSRIDPALPIPVEMGAEFVHGRPAATLDRLRRAGIRLLGRSGTRWLAQNGSLIPIDRSALLAEVERAMATVGLPRRDVSFRSYLDGSLAPYLSTSARELALRMAEGYNASDPGQVSARAIVEEWTGDGSVGDVTFRPAGGYGALMADIARRIVDAGVALRLRSVVHTVGWRRGKVEVEGTHRGEAFRVSAERAIVTLPLGVLQAPAGAAGAVRFRPALAEKQRPLQLLASGPVLRVAMRFRSMFWERLEKGRYRDAGFMQSPDAPFVTYWTSLPARAPLLVAWAGGSRTYPLAQLSAAAVKRHAAASVAALFGSRADVAAQLAATYFHDWQRDPYARGAYAYVKVGGGRARRALAAPLRGTLYFAGEATDCEGEPGTVAGALLTGERAARELLEHA